MSDIPLETLAGDRLSTRSMLNKFTVAGWTAINIAGLTWASKSLSPAMTANTLVDLINETGAGEITNLGFSCVDATPRTIRYVITVDGTQIADFTSTSLVSEGLGCVLAGVAADAATAASTSSLPPIYYSASIRVQYASSLSETGKINTYISRNGYL